MEMKILRNFLFFGVFLGIFFLENYDFPFYIVLSFLIKFYKYTTKFINATLRYL